MLWLEGEVPVDAVVVKPRCENCKILRDSVVKYQLHSCRPNNVLGLKMEMLLEQANMGFLSYRENDGYGNDGVRFEYKRGYECCSIQSISFVSLGWPC